MKCEIIRYKIRSEPFGEPRDCVRCVTHGWDAYEGQGGMMGTSDEICPVGRRELNQGLTEGQPVNTVKGLIPPGMKWDDYLKDAERQAEVERSQLVKLTEDIADMKATMAAQGERLAELLRIAQWLEAKGP